MSHFTVLVGVEMFLTGVYRKRQETKGQTSAREIQFLYIKNMVKSHPEEY